MNKRTSLRTTLAGYTLGLGSALLAAHAAAAALSVHVSDQNGAPVADAVVYAIPADGQLPKRAPVGAVIAQRNKMFEPLVSVIQTGASVNLPNYDDIAHEVYSLSAPKHLELKLYRGVPAHPVIFDKPGLVVLGCNIHDMMVAYLFIVDTPYYAKTDSSGNATLAGLSPRDYRVTVLHYRQSDANARPTQTLGTTAKGPATFTVKLDAG